MSLLGGQKKFLPNRKAPSVRGLSLLLLTSTALVIPAATSNAQTVQWTGATSSDFLTGSNWSSGAVPTSANSVIINTGTAVLQAPAIPGWVSVNLNSLVVGSGAGSNGQLSVSLDGGTSADISADTIAIGSGAGANGRLSVNFGAGESSNFESANFSAHGVEV